MATEVHMHGRLGESIKRKEDGRFLRGKGNYLDDIELPAMLHMVILRSPHAHARIKSVDTVAASAMPGVIAVVTGELMAQHKLAWMPTLSYDTQAVLATDKVRFQGQEVACVVADDPYIAKDACEAIEVEYETLPAIVNPRQALAPDAPVIRDDKADAGSALSGEHLPKNVCYRWEVGDKAGTDRAFEQADTVVSLDCYYPRTHPCPIENCGEIADYNAATGKLTIYMTTQAPHIIRTAVALVAELPEHMIRVISPDIGGGFGNKVPVYPGYVIAILASILLSRPVKWIEDKTGNLISTGYARDMYFHGELAVRKDGKIQAVRIHADTDNGAFFSDAQPTKFKIGLFHSTSGCYDIPYAHLTRQGHYTNKALGAGNSREYDILGIKMFDSAELRVHPSGKAILKIGSKTQGQGHETTFAQIVTHELGIPADNVLVQHGDTDNTPFGMGTYASRSTPTAGAATAMVARKVRAKAKKLAAHLLEVSEEDVEWELGRFYVRSAPNRGVTITDCAFAAYTNMPDGLEPGLENNAYYDPPNMTWPFDVYVTTVEIDPETGEWDVLKFVGVDDCGVRINPMIVEGQLHGGLAEAFAMAYHQMITFDSQGNCIGSNYMDYMIPTAWEVPHFDLYEVVTPSPHHPIGCKGIGECGCVGGPAAFVNAVVDAIAHLGVRNIDMPCLSSRVWEAIKYKKDISGTPPLPGQ